MALATNFMAKWENAHESIQIMEICVGSVLDHSMDFSGIGCLVLYSGAYAPTEALPKI
jgi:hypothetical protein